MTVSEKGDDPASFLVKGFPSWSQWDQLQLIFGAQGKIVPVILGSIVGSRGQSSQICCSTCKEIIFGVADSS